ncbi:MAG: TetR family transcriptional regulator, partial [Gammaproteobacteria bacterium]|nr:TetR family transcriptional regulator [Gammaproteobacteria bacterium]
DVAEAVGVTKAGLYHYFPTKEGLFETIGLGVLRDMQKGAEEAVAS